MRENIENPTLSRTSTARTGNYPGPGRPSPERYSRSIYADASTTLLQRTY
jgi:hypothetical protein